MVGEISCRIARTFGSLCDSVFTASDLTLETKRIVYHSVVLGVLLYGAETWAPTQELVSKLDRFHRRHVHCILGISSGRNTSLLLSWLANLVRLKVLVIC